MISFDSAEANVNEVKLIDFGTSILFEDVNRCLSVTTPEYMPPEVLNFVELKAKFDIARKLHPWSIDVWSLGILTLELVLGFPIYMAYKCRLTR